MRIHIACNTTDFACTAPVAEVLLRTRSETGKRKDRTMTTTIPLPAGTEIAVQLRGLLSDGDE